MSTSGPHTRKLTVIAQDPSFLGPDGRIVRTQVEITAEDLQPGPWGYRVQVVDWDESAGKLYLPGEYPPPVNGHYPDPFENEPDERLLEDPRFHQQNAYALVMRTLMRFEHALGRRISWSFGRHQLKVAPHAFGDANAYYARREEALLFGYFPKQDGIVYACLSHDVVVHETTHALLDALRFRFMEPSSPDQAAFHEGFADIVALLSVFSLPDVVAAGLRRGIAAGVPENMVPEDALAPGALRASVLLSLAEEMGSEMSAIRGRPLRQSAQLDRNPAYYLEDPEFLAAHRRGEILVAAILNTFIEVWSARVNGLRTVADGMLDRERVVEEGAGAADYLMTMAIRALDYVPPVHLEFADFLTAMLTADAEIRPDDSRYNFREHLRRTFAAYGIYPVRSSERGDAAVPRARRRRSPAFPPGAAPEPGSWVPCRHLALSYDRTHFEPMLRDPDEVFRFVWENRVELGVFDGALSQVASVRPCLRVGPDGFVLRETVAEFVQQLELRASELRRLRIRAPQGMPPDEKVVLFGGATLVFDEYGRLKFYIHNALDGERQTARLAHQWNSGEWDDSSAGVSPFAELHLMRITDAAANVLEEW